MEVLLAKVTQQAMNYAIRTGITVTSGYAIQQCGRLLKSVDDSREKREIAALQIRLNDKIKIISPAINIIELIAARGNSSLESTATLTKSLRIAIQKLTARIKKAVGEERLARHGSSASKSRAQNDLELKNIIADMKRLLEQIEDAVPLINLAIATSGVNLSTSLPATVSPSRLLQASTCMTDGDKLYCERLPRSQQIGPSLTLTLYMLFASHTTRLEAAREARDPAEVRETTWKEVIHKARVTLLRVPIAHVNDYPAPFTFSTGQHVSAEEHLEQVSPHIPAASKANEYAYQLLIVEDFDDDRVHTFEEDEAFPTPYEGVARAGIRDILPIHQVSKLFYADTGRILNIGTDGETNNPVLLIKRDLNAPGPRQLVEERQYHADDASDSAMSSETLGAEEDDEEQNALDEQLRRESTAPIHDEPAAEPHNSRQFWRLPPDLDPEWLALEVYREELPSDSEFDDADDEEVDSTESPIPTPAMDQAGSISPSVINILADLNIDSPSPVTAPPDTALILSPQKSSQPVPTYNSAPTTMVPSIASSLSLLEMMIRLASLQQFAQDQHLACPDEAISFFLRESATIGAGEDVELRRRTRRLTKQKVGFDPYDDSPIHPKSSRDMSGAGGPESNDPDGHHYPPEDEESYDDFEGYPNHSTSPAAHRSRSGTPSSSSRSIRSSPGPDYPLPSREGRTFSNMNPASPSPLLRRAMTQAPLHGMKQPLFRNPPTAPPTSSSPRLVDSRGGRTRSAPSPVQMGRGSLVPDTPPSTGRKTEE